MKEVYYSIAAFELLERKLSSAEKEEIFQVFNRVGHEMGLRKLPNNYTAWLTSRNEHLDNDLAYSNLTSDLFKQYKKHLGFRYSILLKVQALLVPKQVVRLMNFSKPSGFGLFLLLYRHVKHFKLLKAIKFKLLPSKYQQLKDLDMSDV